MTKVPFCIAFQDITNLSGVEGRAEKWLDQWTSDLEIGGSSSILFKSCSSQVRVQVMKFYRGESSVRTIFVTSIYTIACHKYRFPLSRAYVPIGNLRSFPFQLFEYFT